MSAIAFWIECSLLFSFGTGHRANVAKPAAVLAVRFYNFIDAKSFHFLLLTELCHIFPITFVTVELSDTGQGDVLIFPSRVLAVDSGNGSGSEQRQEEYE